MCQNPHTVAQDSPPCASECQNPTTAPNPHKVLTESILFPASKTLTRSSQNPHFSQNSYRVLAESTLSKLTRSLQNPHFQNAHRVLTESTLSNLTRMQTSQKFAPGVDRIHTFGKPSGILTRCLQNPHFSKKQQNPNTVAQDALPCQNPNTVAQDSLPGQNPITVAQDAPPCARILILSHRMRLHVQES